MKKNLLNKNHPVNAVLSLAVLFSFVNSYAVGIEGNPYAECEVYEHRCVFNNESVICPSSKNVCWGFNCPYMGCFSGAVCTNLYSDNPGICETNPGGTCEQKSLSTNCQLVGESGKNRAYFLCPIPSNAGFRSDSFDCQPLPPTCGVPKKVSCGPDCTMTITPKPPFCQEGERWPRVHGLRLINRDCAWNTDKKLVCPSPLRDLTGFPDLKDFPNCKMPDKVIFGIG